MVLGFPITWIVLVLVQRDVANSLGRPMASQTALFIAQPWSMFDPKPRNWISSAPANIEMLQLGAMGCWHGQKLSAACWMMWMRINHQSTRHNFRAHAAACNPMTTSAHVPATAMIRITMIFPLMTGGTNCLLVTFYWILDSIIINRIFLRLSTYQIIGDDSYIVSWLIVIERVFPTHWSSSSSWIYPSL